MSTKIHAAADALGNPVRLLFGPGQEKDMVQARELIEGLRSGVVIADKGCDADHLHDVILNTGAKPVIPPRRHRCRPHDHDKALYKERNLIERFFYKLKQFRRVATPYDTLIANFRGFVQFASIAILLR